jgi:hypothetical protein
MQALRVKGVCKAPQDRHPEPGVQVGEVRSTLGSSDARRSRSSTDVPSPSSMSIGSRKYKAPRTCRRLDCRRGLDELVVACEHRIHALQQIVQVGA